MAASEVRRVDRRRVRVLVATTVVAAAAVVLHAILFTLDVWPAPRRPWGDETMYADLAWRIAAGEDAAGEPLFPPGYAHFLASVFALGGGSLLVAAIQVLLLLVAAVIFRDLTLRLTGSQTAAAVAATLLLLDPQVGAFAHYLWPEVVHLGLFLAAAWILVARSEATGWLALSGAAIGLALLNKSVLGPFLLLLFWPLTAAYGWRRGLAKVAIVIAVAAAVHVPTVAANLRRGDPALAASARFNLWLGLSDRTRRGVSESVWDRYQEWQRSGATWAERNAFLDRRIRALVEERGVWALVSAQLSRQYFRLLDRDSFLTDQLPGGPIAARGRGYVDAPASLAALLRAWSYGIYAAVLVAAPLGFALRRPRDRWLCVVLAFAGYQLALFLLLHVKSRYRLPLLPVLYLGAGCFVDALTRRRAGDSFPVVAWAGGGIMAVLALFLGFGREFIE